MEQSPNRQQQSHLQLQQHSHQHSHQHSQQLQSSPQPQPQIMSLPPHSSPLQQHPHQQLQIDSTAAQDVLAEARKNLQVLIDSGLSRDLLHQWVDESQNQSLQLALAPQQLPPQQPSLAIPPMPTIAPPPPPQCPPPPIPTATVTSSNNTSTASTPSADLNIKTEPTMPEDMTNSWPSTTLRGMTSPSENDHQAMFLPPSAPFSHRPRISVSSTSSGSSGHASIWSTNSAQSSVSWQSTQSCSRAQAPLPLPPTPPTALGPPVGTTGKTNIYWCTSCETSFKRKYDWKRHEDEFHERWRKYPCPEPGCNRSFWGSNSFNQHHKQCHGCKTCPHAEKVVKFLRKRKYWACGFCSALHPARERHVEHVARHFESGMTKGDWMHSRVVYGLLHQPLIHEAWDALVISKQSEYNGRRPQFSWHPSKTGRAQGFLENENPGQLQDLLEFFSGDESEAQWIVSVAYELADIVLTSAPIPSPQYSHSGMAAPQGFPQDPRMSFMTLPTQAHHSMIPSPDPSQNPFATPFRNTILVPSQPFPSAPRPSPDSTSHSPLTVSHSPLMPAHSPHDKRELPPPPQQQHDAGEAMMDFEYSPAPIVFEDWESLNSSVMEQQGQHPQTTQAPPDWGMVGFYGDPRVTS